MQATAVHRHREGAGVNLSAADVYTDFSGFARLRAQAREGGQHAREEVARQAEALLLGLVIKSMREAGSAFGSGTDAVQQGLYDNQIALSLASGGRLGFAQTMLRAIGPQAGSAADAPAVPARSASPPGLDAPARSATLSARDWIAVRAAAASQRDAPAPGAHTATPARSDASAAWDSPHGFARALWPAASRAAQALGTRPEAVLAVAALETGWGRRMPVRADGTSSNNLFGIKAHGWRGEVTHGATLEFENGAFARRIEPFRAYPSPQAAVEDFTRFVTSQPRYREALASGGDPVKFVHALHAAGYATDPRYGDKLEALLDSAPIKHAAAAAG